MSISPIQSNAAILAGSATTPAPASNNSTTSEGIVRSSAQLSQVVAEQETGKLKKAQEQGVQVPKRPEPSFDNQATRDKEGDVTKEAARDGSESPYQFLKESSTRIDTVA